MPKKKPVAAPVTKKAAAKKVAAKSKAAKKPAMAIKSKIKAKVAPATAPKSKKPTKAAKQPAKKIAVKKPQKTVVKSASKPIKKPVTKAAVLAFRAESKPAPTPRQRTKPPLPKTGAPKRRPKKASGLKLYAKTLRRALAVKKPLGPQLELLLRAEYGESGRVSKDAERLLGVSRKVH